MNLPFESRWHIPPFSALEITVKLFLRGWKSDLLFFCSFQCYAYMKYYGMKNFYSFVILESSYLCLSSDKKYSSLLVLETEKIKTLRLHPYHIFLTNAKKKQLCLKKKNSAQYLISKICQVLCKSLPFSFYFHPIWSLQTGVTILISQISSLLHLHQQTLPWFMKNQKRQVQNVQGMCSKVTRDQEDAVSWEICLCALLPV